jgi:hypothetical protein
MTTHEVIVGAELVHASVGLDEDEVRAIVAEGIAAA